MRILTILLLSATILTGCNAGRSDEISAGRPDCTADNGGITLPEGFCASVIADSTGRARHLAVAPNGDIYVAMNNTRQGGGILAMRDTTGDGLPDVKQYFGSFRGTEVRLHRNWLYFSGDTMVVRFKMLPGQLVPDTTYEVVVGGFPKQGPHSSKSFAIDDSENLYVNVGAASDVCSGLDGAPDTKGQDPCGQLERHAAVWKFKADQLNQTQLGGERYVRGTRNIVGIAWNGRTNQLYAVQHGRDGLAQKFSQYYTEEQGADLPAEEFLILEQGKNYGWPYCYFDPMQKKRVLAPEYGGDGKQVGRCTDMPSPIMSFPGHWAPNDLMFYTANHFPEKYRNGAFVAFHGSWNRAPFGQQGYNVVFVPFSGELPSGDFEVFASGFAGVDPIESTGDARHRPMGLSQGPDGSLYIVDSVKGKIWRVFYNG